MKVTDIKNCVWSNQEKTSIDCEIKTEEFKDYIPYTALKTDPWPDGAKLFEKIIAEGYEIKEYVPRIAIPTPSVKPIPSIQDLENQLKLLSSQLEELKKKNS